MPDILFHHYPQSPVAEKIRVAFGLMDVSWRSVLIPRLPPKPDLTVLTGGYRRTPVMQIGADIYCDSQCILRELDQRFPDKALCPSEHSLQALGFSQWTDNTLFTHAIRVVLGHNIAAVPNEFLVDRARLYFGLAWTIESVAAGVTHSLSQIQSALSWMEQNLCTGNDFLGGTQPNLTDVSSYYLCWFLRRRYSDGPALLDSFPSVAVWESRIHALGHGNSKEMDSKAPIKIANAAQPEPVDSKHQISEYNSNQVSVKPAGDGGDPAVVGSLVQLNHDHIVISRKHKLIGDVHVHFPRAGYLLEQV